MTAANSLRTRTFASFRYPNYRLYFVAQAVSSSGTWMQIVAENWLIIQLGGSGLALGIATALQFVPTLLLGPIGGVIVDRWNKRWLLIATQATMAALALAMAAVAELELMRVWLVWLAALLFGLVNAVDSPARQAFTVEMVGSDHIANGVALNNAVGMSARALGPALSGFLIADGGIALCFTVNAFSYLVVVLALSRIDPKALYVESTAHGRHGRVGAGLRYARRNPVVRTVLVLVVVAGVFGTNFQLLLTLLASETFAGGSELYSALMAGLGFGMILGSLASANWHRPTVFGVGLLTLALGVSHALVGLAATLTWTFASVVLLGVAAGSFMSSAAGVLQMNVRTGLRGRVMALYTVALLGTTLLGGPAMGWIADATDPRMAFVVGGSICAAFAIIAVSRPVSVPGPEDEEAE